MVEKKKNLKYTSIIPKPLHTLSAYQVFTKSKWNEFPEHIPPTERISKLSEMWKLLPNDEVEIFKERSEILKQENKKEWDQTFQMREQSRREWCGKFGVPNSTSWEEIEAIHRKQWEKKNGVIETKKEKKTMKKKKSKIDSDENNSSSDEEEDNGSTKRKIEKQSSSNGNKKRRVAIDNAITKIRESSTATYREDLEETNSDSDDQKKKKNSKAHQASTTSGSAMLSGSFMSVGSSNNNNNNITTNTNRGIEGHVEGKKLKKRTSRLGDVEWAAATWGEERVKAVIKGIDKVYEMALDQDNFDIFGNDMIQCFYDVATVTGEPIRSKTLKYVEHLANRWKYTVMQDGWKEKKLPTPCEVIEVVTGMYCMERVGIRHDLKAEVLDFLQSKNAYTAKDYFGWDPKNEPLCEEGGLEVISDCHVSKYRLMSSSLIHSFYSDRVGLRLGCDYADIFKWLPLLRPYKGPHQLSWQDYIDQCYLITHIIFTTNNWGELSLEPSLFPHEYFFIRNHLEIHIQQRDVHLISEFVESLRCFGCTDEDPLIRKGIRTLLGLQTDNGIWDPTDDEPYRTYHATMCASQALLAHRFRGYGPGIPAVLPLLVQWSNEIIEKSDEYRTLSRETHSQILVISDKVIKHRELEYGPIVSGDIATEGSITKPKDMTAHSSERMNTLKLAMRSFAKATSHLFTLLPDISLSTESELVSSSSSPSPSSAAATNKSKFGPITEVSTDKIEDQSGIDEANGLILDQLFQTVGRYLQFVGLTETNTPPDGKNLKIFTQEDIQNFIQQLTISTNIPVTAAILQSSRYTNLTKHLRLLSKGKGRNGPLDPNIQVASSKLVTNWKNRLVAENEVNSPRGAATTITPTTTTNSNNTGEQEEERQEKQKKQKQPKKKEQQVSSREEEISPPVEISQSQSQEGEGQGQGQGEGVPSRLSSDEMEIVHSN